MADNPLSNLLPQISNPFGALLNPDVIRQAGDLLVTRALPLAAGIGIMGIGVAFVLSGTKAGAVVGDVADLAITKGAKVL